MYVNLQLAALFFCLAGFIGAQTTTIPRTPPPSPPKPAISNPPKTATSSPKPSTSKPIHDPARSASGNTSTVHSGASSPGKSSHATTGAGSLGSGGIVHPPIGGASPNDATRSPRLSNIYGVHKTSANRPQVNRATTAVTVLPATESSATLRQINTMRSHLAGRNQRPLPLGNITVDSRGDRTLTTTDGRYYEVRRNGALASFRAEDRSAKFSSDGRLASLHTTEMDIRTGPRGERAVVWRRPDQSVVVRLGHDSGYFQRTIDLPGARRAMQRTYIIKGETFTRVYTAYSYHGVLFMHYVPEADFAPGLYTWVYYPWKPVTFTFGFENAPWYVARPAYFTPSPVYTSGYSWLADFEMLSELAKSYDQLPPANAPTPAGLTEPRLGKHIGAATDTPITPTLKDAVAEEVRQQIAIANATASGNDDSGHTELAGTLQIDHVFVVSSLVEVNAGEEQTCTLTGGDVLQLTAPPPEDSVTAQARVASSKRADCPAGQIVTVFLEDLQEMQNDMRAELDAGLRALRDNQGRDGWPTAPASAVFPARPAVHKMPPPDTQVGALLESQDAEAAKVEAGILASAFATR